MQESASSSEYRGADRWVVFGSIGLVYFLVYFHRVSTSVIAGDLIRSFQTNATALGFMSSMYFYLYGFEQPLVGYYADRFGPRRVIAGFSVAAAAGSFLFGLAPSIVWASVGRALIGIGVGGVYVPALKALALWFDRRRFAAMVGLLMSIGNLGAVIATTPLAWAAARWGFRATFHLIGAATLFLALFTLLATRDHPGPEAPSRPAGAPAAAGGSGSGGGGAALVVLSSGQFWLFAAIFFGIYGTLLTYQGLWATPFLSTALGIGRMPASRLNMLVPVGVIIGSPLFGWLSGRLNLDKRRLLIGIIIGYDLAWAALIFLRTPFGWAWPALVQLVLGLFAGGFLSLLWAIIKEVTDPSIFGLTSGMLNPAPFIGVAAFQILTGAILDRAGVSGGHYSMAGFTTAFLCCLAANLICLALAFAIRGARSAKF